jgi:integrase
LIYSALHQCGARPGELCRATIAHVDRANRVITLKEHKTARKTGQPRRIPIGRKLGELLDQAIGDRKEHPVFLSPSGRAWRVENLSRTYSRLRHVTGQRTTATKIPPKSVVTKRVVLGEKSRFQIWRA